MIASLKSELRKIYSIRSTYLILLFCLAVMVFFGFYVEGMKAAVGSRTLEDPGKVASVMRDAISSLAVFGGLVGILSMTHEYRYNTMLYTLTASRSRTRSLVAKVAAVSIFAILFTVVVTVLAVGLMYLGLAVKGYSLGPQVIPDSMWWRVLTVGWGYSLMGLLFAALIRQQVGAIAAFFVLPGLGEMLLGLLLKENRIYLPFTALQQVIGMDIASTTMLSYTRAATVFALYVVVGWLVAWLLFLRRDAI
jgi:ABC-type transport system involved in multi-copper enzyme maturation permease subunit